MPRPCRNPKPSLALLVPPLGRRECLSVDVQAGQVLESQGAAWLTAEGLRDDVVLRPHEAWTAPLEGRVVLEGL